MFLSVIMFKTKDNFMKIDNETEKPSKGYTICWDKVFVAAAILIVVIVGVISLIVFLASGSDSEEAPADTVEVPLEVPGFANRPSNDNAEEDKSVPVKTMKVVIDAGHGGEDGGSTDSSEERIEKDDNLRLSQAVQKELEELGVEVVMTRDSDEFVSLDDRCKIANDAKADLFVSLHRNSAEVGNGVEIWVSKKKPKEDTLLAQNIMDALKEVGISEDREVQFGYIGHPTYDYQVNMDTVMPSCLVEMGFMTSSKDNKLFDKNFDEYAAAIAQAIFDTGEQLGIM